MTFFRCLIDKYKKLLEINVDKKTLKLKSVGLLNDEINIEILILRCIQKLIKPSILIKYSREFLNELAQTRNNKLIYELLKIIEKFLDDYDNFEFKANLLPHMKKYLKSNDHLLRETGLKILSIHFIKFESFNSTKIIEILLNHSEDQDSRVRVAALELLVKISTKKKSNLIS